LQFEDDALLGQEKVQYRCEEIINRYEAELSKLPVRILQWNEVIARKASELSQFIMHETGFFKDGKSIYHGRESDASYIGLSSAGDWDRETRRWLRDGRPVLRKVVEKVNSCTYKVKKNTSREDIEKTGKECKIVFMTCC